MESSVRPLGTAYWAAHPITWELADQHRLSVNEPYRDWLIDAVSAFGADLDVLEVGCHGGAVLRRLEGLQDVRVAGLDVNEQAVALARAAGLAASLGEIPGCLAEFEGRSVDLVVSSYCLAYLTPDDLVLALRHMLRMARKGLVFVEPMAGAGVQPDVYRNGDYIEWRHDYFAALDAAVSQMLAPPHVTMTRERKGPYAGINGVVTARITWPH